MVKRIVLLSFLVLISCKKEITETAKVENTQTEIKSEVVNKQNLNEVKQAKDWLTTSINRYFSYDLGDLDKNMQSMTTKDYYQYKSDAMNIDMDVDGSLSDKEFSDKWKSKFDVSKSGKNVGFLILGQDWDKIEITKCTLVSQDENSYWFDVVLSDLAFKEKYPIKIKVIKENGKFLISDILQETE